MQKDIDSKTNREELAKRRDELRIEMSQVSEERKGLVDKKNALLDTLKKVNDDIKAKVGEVIVGRHLHQLVSSPFLWYPRRNS